jgi:hypothetical protein
MYDPHTHSFVTKIWLEEGADQGRPATWRGTITHVPSGARRHLQSLSDILVFIAPYVEEMGVELDLCWWVRRWLEWRARRPHKEPER